MSVIRAPGRKLVQISSRKTKSISYAVLFAKNLSENGKQLLEQQLREINPKLDSATQMANVYFWVAVRCIKDEGVIPKHLRALCIWVTVEVASELGIDLSDDDSKQITEMFHDNLVLGKILKPQTVFTPENFMPRAKAKPPSQPSDVGEAKTPTITKRRPMTKSHTAHVSEKNVQKSLVDPRDEHQKIYGMLFLKNEMSRIDELYERIKSSGINSLIRFVNFYIDDLTNRFTREQFLEQTRQCGYPDNEALYCVLAVSAAYCAMKLSRRRKDPQIDDMMQSALDTAFIYPPPAYKPIGNFANQLEREFRNKSAQSLNSLNKETIMSEQHQHDSASANDATEASSTNPTTEKTMSDKQNQTNNTTAEDAQASANEQAQTNTGEQQTAETTTNKAETKGNEDKSSFTDWFTTANVVSGLFCLLLAGLAFSGLSWILTSFVGPWLVAMGLGAGIVIAILGAIGLALGAVIGYGIYTIFNWTVGLFKSTPAKKVDAPVAKEAASAAA